MYKYVYSIVYHCVEGTVKEEFFVEPVLLRAENFKGREFQRPTAFCEELIFTKPSWIGI